MIKMLFSIYRRSSYKARRFIVPFTSLIKIAVKLFLKRIYIRGYYQYLDFSDNASFKYYVDKEKYECAWIDFFLKIISLNPKSFVIDVGANYGPYTLAAASIGQYGLVQRIIAFEPDIRPYSSLKKSIIENGFESLVKVHNVIVGDTEGHAKLFKSFRSSASNRTFQTSNKTISFSEGGEIECITLDYFLTKEFEISNSRLIIKIDIEGNELRAMRGVARALSSCLGFVIFFEFHPLSILEVGFRMDEFYQFIAEIKIDFIFVADGARFLQLDDIPQMLSRMKSIENTKDKRFGTGATFFVIGRDMVFQ